MTGPVGLDASAVVALVLQEQPGWHTVEALVARQVPLILPGTVLTEVIFFCNRGQNVSSPTQIRQTLEAAGMTTEPATADDLVYAGELRIMSERNPQSRRIAGEERRVTLSLGDAVALAVIKRLGIPVVTRDKHWKWLVDQGLLDVDVHTF